MFVPVAEGSPSRPMWLIGEALGEEEERTGRPFSGAAGYELGLCLTEAGLSRSDLFITNVAHQRPPTVYRNGKPITNDIGQWFHGKMEAKKARTLEVMGRYPVGPVVDGLAHLAALLTRHNPRLIIACGGTALWALTGLEDITKWRGSELSCLHNPSIKVIPTFHTAAVLRQYAYHRIVVHDLRRAAREADYPELRTTPFTATIPSTVHEVEDWFFARTLAKRPLVCDTEGWSCLDCIGFADGSDTICIPLVHLVSGESYWSPADEAAITAIFLKALTECPITFHNGLWDCQIISAFYGIMPTFADDTMLMQHVLWPALLGGRIDPVTGTTQKSGSSLSLSFCASMYCAHYRYWKDDGRHWDPAQSENDFWRYNCEDCFRTGEVKTVLMSELHRAALWPQYRFQMDLFEPVFDMMAHGLRVDIHQLRSDAHYLQLKRQEVQDWLDCVVGQEFNPNSIPQMKSLFYDSLKVPPLYHRKTKQITLDDSALETISRRSPLLAPLCRQIQNWRSLETEENFVQDTALSPDGRLRFQLNPCGTETMRFSSSTDAFGEGFNMQNLPRPVKDD